MKPDRDGSDGGRVTFRPGGGGAEGRLVDEVTTDRKSASAKEEDEDWRVRQKKMIGRVHRWREQATVGDVWYKRGMKRSEQ